MADVDRAWLVTAASASGLLGCLLAFGALWLATRTTRYLMQSGGRGLDEQGSEALEKAGRWTLFALLTCATAVPLLAMATYSQYLHASDVASMLRSAEKLRASSPWVKDVYGENALTYACTVAHAYGLAAVPCLQGTGQPAELVVMEVWPNSPAAHAGIQRGDIIEQVRRGDGWSAATAKVLRDEAVASDELDVRVRRMGERLDVTLLSVMPQEVRHEGWY